MDVAMLFSVACSDWTRPNGLRLGHRKFHTDMLKIFFCCKGDGAVEQVAQRGGGFSILGDTQGQAGWGFEQPDVAIGVPVHCRGVGLHGL